MAKNAKTIRRAPNQPFVYTGVSYMNILAWIVILNSIAFQKQTISKQYNQPVAVEQPPIYYENQQVFYNAPYTSHENPNYYVPQDIEQNVAQLQTIDTKSKYVRRIWISLDSIWH